MMVLKCELVPAAVLPEVTRFYHAHKQGGRIGPQETCFVVRDDEAAIQGAVRCIPKRDSELGDLNFLRGLYITPHLRQQGWGSQLTSFALEQTHPVPAFCFARSELRTFYQDAGFVELSAAEAGVPNWLANDFAAVHRQQRKKHREVTLMMTRRNRPLWHLILIQHANEPSRPTGTARLLDDPSLSCRLSVERWRWSGRNDAASIAEHISRLPHTPSLVWADSASREARSDGGDASDGGTFILIDGTWQEARSIYRKTPALHSLPRLALRGSPSTYRLRGDFGWRARFARDGDGDASCDALCTAEAAAAVMECRGDAAGGAQVRALLDTFQEEYAIDHPHVHARDAP